MYPRPFQYHRAGSLEEAVRMLEQTGDEARLLAGGQSLIPLMKLRLTSVRHLIDLNFIPGLSYTREENGVIRFGRFDGRQPDGAEGDTGVEAGIVIGERELHGGAGGGVDGRGALEGKVGPAAHGPGPAHHHFTHELGRAQHGCVGIGDELGQRDDALALRTETNDLG